LAAALARVQPALPEAPQAAEPAEVRVQRALPEV